MNLAIIGFGGMGRKIKELAESRDHEVKVIIDPIAEEANYKNINDADLSEVDVILDFSNREAVLDNVKKAVESNKNIIIGTTGWYDKLTNVEDLIKNSNIGLLWSANFSIGVNIFYKLVGEAAGLLDNYDEYDVWGTELHHNNKADSPSGTAKELAKILLEKLSNKNKVVYDKLDRKISKDEIHFSSTRGGAVNFSHTIGFDSPADTITLNHSARSRDGYALGAIKAGEWLEGKKGLFTMDDFLNKK